MLFCSGCLCALVFCSFPRSDLNLLYSWLDTMYLYLIHLNSLHDNIVVQLFHFVPGHVEHVENYAGDPYLPEKVSRCDDRAVLQDDGNRADESFHKDVEKSLSPLVRIGPHGHKNLWIAMALYCIGRFRLKGEGCGAIIWCARVCSRVIVWLAHFVRTISCRVVCCAFCCVFPMRRKLTCFLFVWT